MEGRPQWARWQSSSTRSSAATLVGSPCRVPAQPTGDRAHRLLRREPQRDLLRSANVRHRPFRSRPGGGTNGRRSPRPNGCPAGNTSPPQQRRRWRAHPAASPPRTSAPVSVIIESVNLVINTLTIRCCNHRRNPGNLARTARLTGPGKPVPLPATCDRCGDDDVRRGLRAPDWTASEHESGALPRPLSWDERVFPPKPRLDVLNLFRPAAVALQQPPVRFEAVNFDPPDAVSAAAVDCPDAWAIWDSATAV